MVEYKLASKKDYSRINNFYNRIYNRSRTIEQFEWEFHAGPFGPAIYAIAEDKGKVVGTNCVIPIHLVKSNGEVIISGKSEDTLVDPHYRGQNIFSNIYKFLFQKSKEEGIQLIWGFTPAKRPFKKVGFKIPYDHEQSLVVNNIIVSYNHLNSLNPNNSSLTKVKIFGLCVLSKIKYAISKKVKNLNPVSLVNKVNLVCV